MANDCDYKARISGEPEDLQKLFDKLKIEEIEKNGSLNSTNYQLLFESIDDVEDWGSKWLVFSNIDYTEGDTMMFVDGYSAWSPADGFWKKVSADFNLHITLDYSEPGMGFAGVIEFNDGSETLKEEMDYWTYLYSRDYQYFWEELECRCEWDSFEGIKESIQSVWNEMTDEEIKRLENLHEEKYSE